MTETAHLAELAYFALYFFGVCVVGVIMILAIIWATKDE